MLTNQDAVRLIDKLPDWSHTSYMRLLFTSWQYADYG